MLFWNFIIFHSYFGNFIEFSFLVSRQIQLAGHGAYDAIPSLVLLLFCNEEKIKALTLDVITLVADNNGNAITRNVKELPNINLKSRG